MNARFPSVITLGLLAWIGAGSVVAGCGDAQSASPDRGSSGRSGAGRGGSDVQQGASGSGTAGNTGVNRGGDAGSTHAGDSNQNSGGGGGVAGAGEAGAPTGGRGDAGQSGASEGGDTASLGGAGAANCNPGKLVPTPVTPTVELLVDTSSSMFETNPTVWSVLYDAVMNLDNGVVRALAGC